MSFNSALTPDEKIQNYKLIHRIDFGGSSEIWRAKDTNSGSDFALKIVPQECEVKNDSMGEVQTKNLKRHPNLLKPLEAAAIQRNSGETVVIITMEYLQSGNVLHLVNAGNFIPIKTAIPILIDVLRGLEFLHTQDICHNDIKPRNILIGDSGEGVLTDYGISTSNSGKRYVRPSHAYRLHAAPELLEKYLISIQTDIYQFGLTMFRLLNGIGKLHDQYSMLGGDAYHLKVKTKGVVQEKDYLPFIPANLKSIIRKATQVDPAKRYQTALELRNQLEALSYAGDWTCEADGSFIGETMDHTYRFEEIPLNQNHYRFDAFKKNKTTGTERRVRKYCSSKLNRADLQKLKQQLMQQVILGYSN